MWRLRARAPGGKLFVYTQQENNNMITLYWCPRSRAARALWMLEELGEPFEVKEIDIQDPESKNDMAFRIASPMGKVPAIADGDVMLAESAAICMYLADKYAGAGLAPAIDDAARGRYLYWMMFTPGVLEPAMAEKFGGWEPNPYSHGWGDFDSMIKTLEAGLKGGDWILGDRFSAADVMLGSSANFLKMFGILPESGPIDAYIKRCLARPAYQRALAREEG